MWRDPRVSLSFSVKQRNSDRVCPARAALRHLRGPLPVKTRVSRASQPWDVSPAQPPTTASDWPRQRHVSHLWPMRHGLHSLERHCLGKEESKRRAHGSAPLPGNPPGELPPSWHGVSSVGVWLEVILPGAAHPPPVDVCVVQRKRLFGADA